jgi:hypothetical protein
MVSNGTHGHDAAMAKLFPEARQTLAEADPEVYALIQDEKRRQWCVFYRVCDRVAKGASCLTHTASKGGRTGSLSLSIFCVLLKHIQPPHTPRSASSHADTTIAYKNMSSIKTSQAGHRADRQRKLYVGARHGGARCAA